RAEQAERRVRRDGEGRNGVASRVHDVQMLTIVGEQERALRLERVDVAPHSVSASRKFSGLRQHAVGPPGKREDDVPTYAVAAGEHAAAAVVGRALLLIE